MSNLEKNYFEVINAPTPKKTHSYTPVPNQVLIDEVKENLYKANYNIVKESYQMNPKQTQLFAVMELADGTNGMHMNIGFRNSYDKSLSVGFVAGATVIVCSNLMFEGDIKIMRKHTNRVFKDLGDLIEDAVEVIDENFEIINRDSEQLKALPMSKTEMAKTAGQFFIEEDLITSTQLNVIKREINGSPLFTGETVWDFYNHLTEGCKVNQPTRRMNQQIELHKRVLQLA